MTRPILADVLELSIPEKILLVEDIWDSIASNSNAFPNMEEHKAELDKRLEDYRQNPADGSSWEEVKVRCCIPNS